VISTLPRLDAAIPRPAPAQRTRFVASAMTIVAFLLLAVVLQAFLVSPLRYARDQHVAYDDFRYQLANSTAPVGQVGSDDRLLALGTGVAILRIPALGVDDVVLEGTTSEVMLSGPGHRRDTVLPGQVGASVVMGRQSTYGGPFGTIADLEVGDAITTITGQGEATYRVSGVRRSGDPLPAVLASGAGRLTLVSAAGRSYMPDDVVRVDADLVSTPFATPVQVLSQNELPADEMAYAGDDSAWPWLVIALVALAVVVLLTVLLRRWWGRRQGWVVGVPLIVLCGVLVTQQVMVLLPNLV